MLADDCISGPEEAATLNLDQIEVKSHVGAPGEIVRAERGVGHPRRAMSLRCPVASKANRELPSLISWRVVVLHCRAGGPRHQAASQSGRPVRQCGRHQRPVRWIPPARSPDQIQETRDAVDTRKAGSQVRWSQPSRVAARGRAERLGPVAADIAGCRRPGQSGPHRRSHVRPGEERDLSVSGWWAASARDV